MFNFTISLKVTSKQGLLVSAAYTGAEQKDLDLIVPELEKTVVKLLGRDDHKDPKKPLKSITGDIMLPEGKGTWDIVLSLVGTPALPGDFTVTWPKSDKRTALKIETALLKLMEFLNDV